MTAGKVQAALLAILVLVSIVALLGPAPVLAAATCTEQIRERAGVVAASRDYGQALTLARTAREYTLQAAGYAVFFNSVFHTWSFDASCEITENDVNVVFEVRNATDFVRYLVVTENPELTRVLSVTTQEATGSAAVTIDNPTWAGYEFAGTSQLSNPSIAVYEAKGRWSVPSVSEPYAYACFWWHCDAAVWVGLVHDSGGPSATGIVQAGTNSGVYCTPACTTFYDTWYEFWPAQSQRVLCYAAPVSPGNAVEVDVRSRGASGGSYYLYDITITNLTTGRACTVSGYNYSQMGLPRYGEFIDERLQYSNQYSRVAKFGSVTITGSVYYQSTVRSIYEPYSQGWYYLNRMRNTCSGITYTNINVGTVSLSGLFTLTWLTSACT